MKKVLIAGIASNATPGHPYPDLVRTSLETWDSVPVDGMETFFYFNREWNGSLPKCIKVNAPGDLHSMGKRNLLAFTYALHKLPPWDYMARINASCYVRKPTLMAYCQNLPETGLFRGVGASPTFLWGGAHYIISRDVVQAIVDNAAKWDHAPMEDVSISKLVLELGYKLDNTGRACSVNRKDDHWICIAYGGLPSFEFKELPEMARASDQHFIRVKQDLAREKDMQIMRALHKAGI